jgi:hypothetical protein
MNWNLILIVPADLLVLAIVGGAIFLAIAWVRSLMEALS